MLFLNWRTPKYCDFEPNHNPDGQVPISQELPQPTLWQRTFTPESAGSDDKGPAGEKGERKIESQCLNDYIESHRFNWKWSVIFFFASLATYLTDIGCDIYLITSYFNQVWIAIHFHPQGQIDWAIMTLSIVSIPAVITTSFSLTWYVLDRRIEMEPERSAFGWTWRIFLHGLLLAPIVR